MKRKKTGTNRLRQNAVGNPTPAQIARARSEIQSTWSTREKRQRRVDAKHQPVDPRIQAHVRFIKFLVELEAKNH